MAIAKNPILNLRTGATCNPQDKYSAMQYSISELEYGWQFEGVPLNRLWLIAADASKEI